jgi:hypothetical protein
MRRPIRPPVLEIQKHLTIRRHVNASSMRAVLGFLRRRARQAGAYDGRGGAVAIIQWFGAAWNLNVHVHALVLDAVYVEAGGGALRFHACPEECGARERGARERCACRGPFHALGLTGACGGAMIGAVRAAICAVPSEEDGAA